MSKETLQKQADRAEAIAEQTVDDVLKETLRDAAAEYREEANEPAGFALFRGDTQLAGTFATEQEVLNAALAEGLIPQMPTSDERGAQVLPADYHIEKVGHYDPQPGLKGSPGRPA